MNSVLSYLIVFVSGFIFQTSADCQAKPVWKLGANNHLISSWLLYSAKKCLAPEVEYPSFDGWYHNLGKIELGSLGQPLLKGWAGISTDKSKEKNWSEAWSKIMPNISACRETNNRISLFFSNLVAEEILNTGNPVCGERYDLSHQHQQYNYASPYIDGEVIYGTSRYRISKYVSSKNGTISNLLGDRDVNYDFKYIWIQWHNILADELHKACPNWSGEKIFNEARKFTIAVQQTIFVNEWISEWTGKKLVPYKKYDPSVDPQVERLFQSAMYLPHVTVDFYYTNVFQKINPVRSILKSSYKTESFITQFAHMSCENHQQRELLTNTEQFVGLPDINHARKAFKLTPYSKWTNFLQINKLDETLLGPYFAENNLQQLDSLKGGILESKKGPGELFVEVIHDQFRRIRDGDRFWFENSQNNLFSEEEICRIKKISINDIICSVAGVKAEWLFNTSFFNLVDRAEAGLSTIFIEDKDTHFADKTPMFGNNFLRYGVIMLVYFFGLLVSAFGLIAWKRRLNKSNAVRENLEIKDTFQDKWNIHYPLFLVKEYDGTKGCKKRILLTLDKHRKQIIVYATDGTILRTIICQSIKIQILTVSNKSILILKSFNNYDLVLKFESNNLLQNFINELDIFMAEAIKEGKPTISSVKWKSAKDELFIREQHQILLEMFFRVAFAQAFNIEHSMKEILGVDTSVATEVVYTKLTVVEFAECLKMSPKNEFVRNMFSLVDRDQTGFICFRQFLDLIILFVNGKEEEKAHLFFKLYDIDGTAVLPPRDFKAMLSSFFEIVGERGNKDTTKRLLVQHGIENNEKFDFGDFKKLIGRQLKNLSETTLDSHKFVQNNLSYLATARQTIQSMYSHNLISDESMKYTIPVIDKEQDNILMPLEQDTIWRKILVFYQCYFTHLCLIPLINLVILYVFVDKTCYFYFATKLMASNKYMLAVSKGASYGIILTYSVLLLTMCRNIFTLLKDTFRITCVPFSCLESLHYHMEYLSAVFTLTHVVGKAYLFLWFTDSSSTTICEDEAIVEEIETIVALKWANPVTVSGFLLVPLVILIYGFARPYGRRRLYQITLYLHPFIFILIVIHGALSQWPLLYSVLSGPLFVFVLDSLLGIKRRTFRLPVLQTKLLPSNVICLILKRPNKFYYEVGQWVHIAIDQIESKEFHRFTLSSTPFEPNLRIYIPPTNPYSHQLRTLVELPTAQIRVCMEGPYGIGLQRWRLHDVTILIGVAARAALFASVLKDIVHILQTKTEVPCKKVYFIWILKTQKHFEWLADLIRKIEETDEKDLFSGHLFITEDYENYDLRTIMLMICDKYYKRISDRSIFTGLRAVPHFGKPKFPQLFQTVRSLHKEANSIGVFSSGPISLMRTVETACNRINSENNQLFEHRLVDTD